MSKTLQLYMIFSFCIVCMRGISIKSIVPIKCESWNMKLVQGCIGTFILPNVVLTTSYCAENCQSVGNVRIVRSYIHPHYKNYVHGSNFVARNDIALVTTPKDGRRRKLVKLSALDSLSTIGMKALIPIMDKDKPRLQVTLIERCYKQHPFGYYVCANNKITKQTIKVCQERQEQGVPLLLEDRIFGVMGITDTASCKLPQRSFTAIGPALYWISATVKELGYTDDIITTLHDGKVYDSTPVPQVKTTTSVMTTRATQSSIPPTSTIQSSIRPTTTHQTFPPTDSTAYSVYTYSFSTNFTTPGPTTPIIEDRERIREEETKKKARDYLRNNFVKPFYYPDTMKGSYLKSIFGNISFPQKMRLKDAPSIRREDFTTSTTQRTDDPRAAITFIPRPTSSSRTRTTTTTMQPTAPREFTTITIPFFKLLSNNKTTNVMDWFNINVKNKLINNPQMYFVVSSSTTTRLPLNFIDLT